VFENKSTHFAMGLTAQKMKECVWLRPEVVAHSSWNGPGPII
jgi:hypothetical protein